MPYGRGGGGILRHQAAPSDRVIYVGSMSKAFSVPLAFAAGPAWVIAKVRRASGALVHSSPPALPLVAAARAALQLNGRYGDPMRHRLWANVRHFQCAMHAQGFTLSPPTDFPIQSLPIADPAIAKALAHHLRRKGIWALLQISSMPGSQPSLLRFIITRQHSAPLLTHAAATTAIACSHKQNGIRDARSRLCR